MARYCPHCDEFISFVNFECSTVGWESGTLNDTGDWDTSDSGTDDTDHFVYKCPECGREVSRSSSWIEVEEELREDEEEVDNTPQEANQ